MEGEITLESRAGEGSCFRFEFHAPATAVVPARSETARRVIALAPGQGEIRVLVVDDEATNRKLLKEMLTPLGFSVAEASGGKEAIARASAYAPRIILMDLVMPGMDGIEATQLLRQTCPAGTTIIGISASAFEKEKQHFLDSGINAFIAKPFREQELFDVLARHAGVVFETEAIPPTATDNRADVEQPTLEKVPAVWREAFTQALVQGSITRLRRMGEEAKAFDPILSAFVLDHAALYDLDALKKLSAAKPA